MQITIELPEDIAQGLESRWKDLPRAALESLALEAYRSGALTAAQLCRLSWSTHRRSWSIPAWIRTTIRETYVECVSCRVSNGLKCRIGPEKPTLVHDSYTASRLTGLSLRTSRLHN